MAASRSGTVRSCCASSSCPSCSCLRSSRELLRSTSIARCLAVAMSQAPGLRGTPDCGHCSSAATSASCARSSATPTSRTMRVRPAMSLADSIRQIASMVRCVSEAVTAPNHIIGRPGGKSAAATTRHQLSALRVRRGLGRNPLLLLPQLRRELLAEVLGLEHLPNLDLRLGAGHRVWDPLDPLDCLFLRLHLDEPKSGDEL